MQQVTMSAPGATPASSRAILAPGVHAHCLGSDSPSPGWIKLVVSRLRIWIETRADAAATAALYRELSKLSDAELERRGIPRGELHRCVALQP